VLLLVHSLHAQSSRASSAFFELIDRVIIESKLFRVNSVAQVAYPWTACGDEKQNSSVFKH